MFAINPEWMMKRAGGKVFRLADRVVVETMKATDFGWTCSEAPRGRTPNLIGSIIAIAGKAARIFKVHSLPDSKLRVKLHRVGEKG